jgi:dipeptide/tripeptide permease
MHSEEDATIAKHTRTNPWRLATVTEVEEVKLVIRLLPIWVAALLFATLPAQISTFYTRQGNTLNVNLSKDFKIPAASLQSFIPITIVSLSRATSLEMCGASRCSRGSESASSSPFSLWWLPPSLKSNVSR